MAGGAPLGCGLYEALRAQHDLVEAVPLVMTEAKKQLQKGKKPMSSWRTTTLGILMLVAEFVKLAISLLQGEGVSLGATDAALVGGGIGLLNARDHRAV